MALTSLSLVSAFLTPHAAVLPRGVSPRAHQAVILASEQSTPPPSPSASRPERQIDPRGFVVPQLGDVVKMPSKWPGEYDVAQVDYVQFIGSRGGYEVDLLPLKPIGKSLYRMPGRKPASMRFDVAKLGSLDAEYVAESDAYRIDEASLLPIGGKKVENANVTAAGIAEYEELKASLLFEAALLGAAGTLASVPFYDLDTTVAFAAGAVAGCLYLFLLQREADSAGGEEGVSKAVTTAIGSRLLLPFVLMCFLAGRQGGVVTASGVVTFSSIPRLQFVAAVLGFLTYKAPLLVKQIARAIKELGEEDAQAPLTAGALPTGSLGLMVKVAQKGIKAREEQEAAKATVDGSGTPLLRPIVVSGPSGVGKSTLVGRLLQELPERFGFSLACTTRPRETSEVEGVDYFFKSEEEFDAMDSSGELIDSVIIGKYRYATPIDGIKQVIESGKVCLIDTDLKGLQMLRARADLRPYCIWIAPPALEELRTRLERRGTATPEQINRLMSRARDEIEDSLSLRCFDKIVMNDKIDDAYAELAEALFEL